MAEIKVSTLYESKHAVQHHMQNHLKKQRFSYALAWPPLQIAAVKKYLICANFSESVKCRFSKCRFSVLNLKFDFISDGGCTREKQIQKALGSLPPCGNRCRFSESAICSPRAHPPSEINSNFKFKTLRWRPLRWRLTLSEFWAVNTF